jgi:hypothetical protein
VLRALHASVEVAFADDFIADLDHGLEVIGVAIAASLAAIGLLYLPGLNKKTHTVWYLVAYALSSSAARRSSSPSARWGPWSTGIAAP